MTASNLWRYRCPEGHTNWKRVSDGYKCMSCAEFGGDPHFNDLVDVKRTPL